MAPSCPGSPCEGITASQSTVERLQLCVVPAAAQEMADREPEQDKAPEPVAAYFPPTGFILVFSWLQTIH